MLYIANAHFLKKILENTNRDSLSVEALAHIVDHYNGTTSLWSSILPLYAATRRSTRPRAFTKTGMSISRTA